MKQFLFLITTLFTSHMSLATEIWSGTGKLYGIDRSVISEYNLEVKIEPTTATKKTIDVTVTDMSGKIIENSHYTMTSAHHSWTKSCDKGESSGFMFDYGLGIDYYTTQDGRIFVTNMIFDSDVKMRLMRTELAKGKAEHFFAEVLTKKIN